MFKPESYITPILLSYVDKYIKNFRLEDSQVSLWGGDASFHNLDLRLEVLEQELQLPFSFVSGHIHELLIHVPWIKLTSEPITITINTIECILKLKRHGGRSHSDTSLQSREKRKSSQKEALEAPPTYVQSIINKIVNNIRIYCNNLILKYVEEDIVLSMNVKHFKVETADDKWEPAFIDVSTGHVTQRKVIGLNDLTICLDKRNSAGKIDVYQEPMLYRCSLAMHLMRTYHSATANKTSITRLDIYCNSMEFSMTEQQVPMVMRLLLLMYTLQQHQFKLDSENGTEAANTSTEVRDRETQDTWTGWVWSYVSVVLPSQWDDDWQENPLMNQRGHSFHSGIYINEMSVVFKVSDTNPSHTFYAQRKVRYIPVMALYLQGIYMDNKMHGIQWMNVQAGVSSILLLPIGFCTCGHPEIPDNKDAQPYLKIGSMSDLYQKDSLFDQNAVENQGGLRVYSTDLSYHMAVNDITTLLEKTSACGFDYVYSLQIPDDMSADALSEIGSDLEYSNLHEEVSVRAVFGSMVLRLCSGFFHRMDSLKVAGSVYEYPPYVVPKPLPTRDELLPPSAEDFDALNEHISTKTVRITLNNPIIELQLFDHPSFMPTLDKLFRRKRKYSSLAEALYISHLHQQSFLPKLTFECQTIDISSFGPLYDNRLIFTTCQLPDPPKHMFDACYIKSDYKVVSMSCKLVLNPNKQTIIMVPFSFSYQTREIIKPNYWINPDVPLEDVVFEIESFTINGTKAKQLLINQIISQAWNSYYHLMGWGNVDINEGNPAGITTLIVDAFRDYIMPCLELCVENIRFKSVTTNSIYSLDASLGSIKGFIFESVPPKVPQNISSLSGFNLYDIQQILFISGPEPKNTSPSDLDTCSKFFEDIPLFTMTIQYPLNPHSPSHPSLFIFNLREIRVCMDPLFCKWFLYKPKVIKTSTDIYSQKRKTPSEASSSIKEAPKRIHTPKESVHSSSERDVSHLLEFPNENPSEEYSVDLQDKIYNFLITWFNVWKGMLLYGDISQCTIYFPMESLSAVGSQGIQEAVNQAVNKQPPADVMVIALPLASIRSTQKQDMSKYMKKLPIKLPDTFWSLEKTTFPWTVSISDLSCYTVQYGNKLLFLNPVSLNATVGLSTRSSKSSSATLTESVGNSTVAIEKADIACLGVCVHIDMTSIVISTSEIQMYLLTSILYGLVEMASCMVPDTPGVATRPADVSNPVVITEFPPVSPPPIMKESTLETLSESSYPLSSSAAQMGESDSVKLTAWVQCTITKFSVELFSCDMTSVNSVDFYRHAKLKFVLDAEDIVTSLDFQSIYLKIKCKIGLVSMQHFKRKSTNAKWTHGSFSGIIMRLRDDIVTNDRHEDNGFISVTITRASCQHTHTLWSAAQKRKTAKKSNPLTNQQVSSRYITEIVVNIQPIDMIIPLKTLRKFYLIVQPLLNISMPKGVGTVQEATNSSSIAYNNQNLPLAYLDCQDIRIIMPSSEMRENKALYDVLVVQIHKIKLNPSAVNPICRTPSRPDIYQQAAQARLLNIPGSELEDRQYQMDIIGLSISTGVWDNLEAVLTSPTNIISALHGASENPALEWNNLERGQLNINPVLKLWQVTEKFDINIVVAPAMVYRDVVICGNSMEVNLITDIFINLSLSQIKLMFSIAEEFAELVQPLQAASQVCPFYEIKIPFKFDAQFEQDSDIDLLEVLRDSGVDTSDMKSMGSLRTLTHAPPLEAASSNVLLQVPELLSNELLFTGGKVTFCLYCLDTTYFRLTPHKKRTWQHMHVIDEDNGYDASEEGSVVDDMQGMGNKFMPLLYLSLSQPNLYLSSYYSGERFQVSCFDIDIRVSSAEQTPLRRIPSEDDFKLRLIETRSGKPSAVSGILPAFFTLKYFRAIGKPAVLDVDIMKPSKLIISPKIICRVLQLNQMIAQSLKEIRVSGLSNISVENVSSTRNSDVVQEHYKKFGEIKELLCGIGTVNISLEQILLSLKSNQGPEMSFSFGKAYNHLSICNKPEKVTNIATIKCMTLSIKMTNFTKILLNPWSVSVETNLYWESWQDSNSDPQVQILGESDSLMIDISQEHLKYLRLITKELEDFMSSFPCNSNSEASSVTAQPACSRLVDRLPSSISDKEQYYKDDLRAGAFQFVDASSSNSSLEMPLPYQVMFWCEPLSAMAWRYPQPRALTKVRIFPVPYKLTEDTRDGSQVLCYLEYWSECHNMYLPYCQFFLSENEVVDLQLPDDDTQKIVACTWRVVLKFIDENCEFVDNFHSKSDISPRVLAACMRIDSYFNKNLIPRLAVALNISRIQISLFSYFDKTSSLILPHPLKQYSSDLFFPESHSFLTLTFENLKSHLIFWDFEKICSDITVLTKCSVIDYAFLTRQPFVESFASRLELKVADDTVCNFTANPVNIKCCPGIAHTLAVNAQLWSQTLNQEDENVEKDFIVITRYVICNDSDINLRFGQFMTEEDLLLPPKYFNMYSWRSQKQKQLLKVGLEQNDWVWSEAFSIDQTGTQMIPINTEGFNWNLVVTVRFLSSTQKQIVLGGQFVVSNMLLEHFDLKIVEAVENIDKDRLLKNSPVHIVAGKSVTPSMFIDTSKKHFLRLRFFGLNSAWTGDIPLTENAKSTQPWLVKVPLQERGQFLSIWCRVVEENLAGRKKLLAMLWPLFAIRSNLSINMKVQIETKALNIKRMDEIRGKGELQQLHCPGTIDHAHELIFTLNESPMSAESIPLNYSMVDQETFFQKSENQNIDSILESISKYDEINWPHSDDEWAVVNWITDDQPLTHVQVKYVNACPYSSTLLVELIPWCLMVNVFGYPVSVIVDGVELCSLPHNGIVAPPKLEDTFALKVIIGDMWRMSPPLQLAKSNWSQSFYMPTITGSIPVEGTIKTTVTSKSYISLLSISSQMNGDVRLLKLSSTHVLTNYMSTQAHVICYAVPEVTDKLYEIPVNLERFAFAVAPRPNKNKCGLPVVQWHLVDKHGDLSVEFALYMMFSLEPESGWSCPVRVDKPVNRKSINLITADRSYPVVVICQELKGQMFVTLLQDTCPQTCIENITGKTLYIGQSCRIGEAAAAETAHFNWHCKVEDGRKTYYTTPLSSDKFPEIPQVSFPEQLVFSSGLQEEDNKYHWSEPVDITNNTDQFLRIPYSMDIRVIVRNTACTTFILLESVSKVEIRAKDIRVRLSKHETASVIEEDRKTEDKIRDLPPIKESVSDLIQSITPSTSAHHNERRMQSADARQSSFKLRNKRKQQSRSGSELGSKKSSTFSNPYATNRSANLLEITTFLSSISITLIEEDRINCDERSELGLLTCDNVALAVKHDKVVDIQFSISDIQFDNQAYSRAPYDFPVVLIGQKQEVKQKMNALSTPINRLLSYATEDALFSLKIVSEICKDISFNGSFLGMKDVHVSIQPISCFIEDIFMTSLNEYLSIFSPDKVILWPNVKRGGANLSGNSVCVPDAVLWQALMFAQPIMLRTICIEPLSLSISMHCTVKLYVALDQSPLDFRKFERKRVCTTSYRLGHALAMQYMSSAIFGAGWVVSSLELLGSPGGFARTMGAGLRDFINLPYRGLFQGPWAFLAGITHGSASLMKHATAGTLQSLTKMASSFARNFDKLTMDEEHVRRAEELRRQKPQGLTQGLAQGLTGMGISLLGAVGGLAHHPIQSLMSPSASAKSVAAGLGLGLVGIVTKPLSSAAELVALAGQGLLQGAGWTSLPCPRMNPTVYRMISSSNAVLKYSWKFIHAISHANLLYVAEATAVTQNNIFNAADLILTTEALIIFNTDLDVFHRVTSLSEVSTQEGNLDPTLLCFKLTPPVARQKNEDENVVEMDPACRARVADYVRNTAGLLHLADDGSHGSSDFSISPLSTPITHEDHQLETTVLNFYVNPLCRNYFLCLLALSKQQGHNYHFPLL